MTAAVMTERTWRFHLGCIPALVLLALLLAAVCWLVWGGLLLFIHAVSVITEIGANVP